MFPDSLNFSSIFHCWDFDGSEICSGNIWSIVPFYKYCLFSLWSQRFTGFRLKTKKGHFKPMGGIVQLHLFRNIFFNILPCTQLSNLQFYCCIFHLGGHNLDKLLLREWPQPSKHLGIITRFGSGLDLDLLVLLLMTVIVKIATVLHEPAKHYFPSFLLVVLKLDQIRWDFLLFYWGRSLLVSFWTRVVFSLWN